MSVEVRRSAERFVSAYDGVVSRHSFSFGAHYDPLNTAFGPLVCCNDDELQPRRGYALHPHRDLEIVSWVMEGELHHRHDGHTSTVSACSVQRLSAGSGVLHEECAGERRTRFVQTWVLPDEPGAAPSYASAELPDDLGLLPIAGPAGAVTLGNSQVSLAVARLVDQAVTLPDAPRLHVFVTRGSVTLETGETLADGDEARIADAGGLIVHGNGEALVWALPV